jgi:hypothetical protein
MTRRLVALLLPAAILLAATPRVPRSLMQNLERGFDQRIERWSIDDPFYLLGSTRGVYLEDYGVILTAEMNLLTGPALSPFRPKLTKDEVNRLHQKKLTRLPALRQVMRDMMVTTATTLGEVPPSNQIVVGVSLFYHSWEERAGLPGQIVMRAPRQTLLDIEAGRLKGPGAETAVQIQEF